MIHAAPPPAHIAPAPASALRELWQPPFQIAANYSPVQYVVVIAQEDRGFNFMFAGTPPTGETNVTTTGHKHDNSTVSLSAISLGSASPANTCGNPHHNYADFVTTYNSGSINGFDQITVTSSCSTTVTPYSYCNSDCAPYVALANSYAISDMMFQTNVGSTASGLCYLWAGHCGEYTSGNLDFVDNPLGATEYWGCDSAGGTVAHQVSAASPFPGTVLSGAYPCIAAGAPQLGTLLDNAGISWKWYCNTGNPRACTPLAFSDVYNGADVSKVISPETTVLSDISGGTLAHVSFVTASLTNNDDPPETSGQAGSNGPNWTTSVINALIASKYWPNTVILFTFGNAGNWYDNVTPCTISDPYLSAGQNPLQCGYRVPFIAISPFSKPGYIDHVPRPTACVPRFIETVFSLPSMGTTDQACPDTMFHFFDFSRGHRWFWPVHGFVKPPAASASVTLAAFRGQAAAQRSLEVRR